ncbi:MAG: hypothetical protein NTV79_05515, partial [Candidatus Aureabacteria bacterium]|nr:hypothetical protein [Candidatus Auribacterota bacterium]
MVDEEKGRIRSKPPWAVFLLVFLCYGYFTYSWPGYWNTNEYSRVFLTRALIDNQKFSIDDIIALHNTQDKSFYNGHFYTNKAPGSSLLATPAYLVLRLVEINFRFQLSEEAILYLIKLVCLSAISVAFLSLMFKFWGYISLIFPIREAFLIVYALGTLVWPYSTLYYGHLLSGLALFLGFLILFDARDLIRGTAEIVQAGFFCGLAFLIEYPTLIVSLVIFLYACAVFKNKKAVFYLLAGAAAVYCLAVYFDDIAAFLSDRLVRWIPPPLPPVPGTKAPLHPSPGFMIPLLYILGALYLLILSWKARVLFLFLFGLAAPVGIAFFYHNRCFGGPFNFPYYFETYQEFFLAHSRGIAGVTVPRFDLILQLLFSPFRGLFYYSPILLLAPFGIVKMLKDRLWRKEGALILLASIAYLLFNGAFSDWEGGWSMGPRHLVPLIPFWLTAVMYLAGKSTTGGRRVLAAAAAPLGVISIVFMAFGVSTFPYFPKEFSNPLYDLSVRFLLRGKYAPNLGEFFGLKGLETLIPFAAIVGGLILLYLFDLSWMFSRRRGARAVFCLVGLGVSALLL